ncbi:alpha/beta hydrolase [Gracilibacillus kekensis]|uniref:Lysophospholipase, alpha-beta hydrolase superfamily n=1 Tax=Gracilibacillus kekensis TaxID=1027249 RepID=A0A1M7MTS2_9BACI|nr:alpha/beta hydrolase [Gracilibacillus kekensis]SHM94510.1 Lysophospholipase, alpha-beta hydrolase superfamily [Gracilibacillus kekensis]
MYEESFWYHTNDQHQLFVRCWRNTVQPKAVVQLAHGMVEHIERYNEFATYLADQGFIVYGHDHRGHGRTGEKADSLGFFAEKDGFERVVQDCIELTEFLKKEHPSLPVFLIGHSMGSFISRRYIMLNPEYLNGVILVGTGFQPSGLLKFGKGMVKSVRLLKGKLSPSPLMNNLTFLGYNKKTDKHTKLDWLCSNPTEVKKYQKDPLCGFIPSLQFFYDFYKGIESIQSKANSFHIPKDLPLLFLSGKEDPVGQYGKGVEKTVSFYQSIGMESIEYHLYNYSRHELLNETNKEEAFQDISEWLNRQIACKKSTQYV